MCAVPSSADFFEFFWRFLCSLRFLERSKFSITFSRFAICLFFVAFLWTANLVTDAPSLSSFLLQKFLQLFWTFSSTFDWSWFLPYAFAWLSLPPQPALTAHSLVQRTLCRHLVVIETEKLVQRTHSADVFRLLMLYACFSLTPSIPSLSVIHDFIGCPF
jgi:hypothetical protein